MCVIWLQSQVYDGDGDASGQTLCYLLGIHMDFLQLYFILLKPWNPECIYFSNTLSPDLKIELKKIKISKED